jgi:hypothetical protein
MHLSYNVVAIEDLLPITIEQMLRLLGQHFDNVDADTFAADLAAKDRVILLHEPEQGRLCGFSTLQVYAHEDIRVAFSGDTIIAPEHWGSIQLPLAFGHTLLNELERRPDQPLYWLLTSKGFRTYRFLPVFFRQFAPHFAGSDQGLTELRNRVAQDRWGERFDASAGLLRADSHAQRLSDKLLERDRQHRQRDPHIAYFFQHNPGYAKGDELVCFAPFRPDNLCAFVRRKLVG